ncbi:uncharacterized protein LOC120906229 [Anopheles arabiensis]|uniref:uncharacterized protein LOC120906229 n=1 Tax=Anopheles arabiensis TaxID=7173 RepID=UPI001AAD35C5|nr:uncharacterized protein LOC120906229 [Anopheles arabiensis]
MEGTLLDTAEECSGNSCAVQKKIDQLELEKKLLTLQKEVSEMKLQTQVLARASGLLEYNALKQTLIETFQQTYSVESVYHELRSRRLSTSKSTITYFIDMKNIARKAKIPEGELVDIIIEGINDPVNTAAMRYAARQMDDLLPLLKRYEEMRTRHQPSTSAPKDRRSTRDVPMNIEHVKCYNCLQQGHYQSQCQRPQRPHGSCFRCSKTGHSHRECPNRNNVPAAAVHSMDMESGYLQQIPAMQEYYSNSNNNRVQTMTSSFPIVCVSVGNQLCEAVIDTCSDVTLMRWDLFQELKLNCNELKPSARVIKGYGGKKSNVCGELTIRATIDEVEEKIRFVVVPSNSIDTKVLIGIDVLKRVNYVITNGHAKITKQQEEEEKPTSVDDRWVYRIVCESHQEIDAPSNYRRVICDMVNNYEPAKISNVESEMKILVNNEEVVRTLPRRIAPLEKEVVRKQVREWLNDGIIQPSRSPYASAVVVVPKKDGSHRVCVDYREMNKRIVRDSYPMPNIEDQIDQLADARVYSVLDLKNSYFHVKVEKESRQYTSFVTTDGQYEFLRAPFGLCLSGNAFGRFIDAVLHELIIDGTVMAFVDDIIIPSRDEEHGLASLRRVLEVAQRAGLHFN